MWIVFRNVARFCGVHEKAESEGMTAHRRDHHDIKLPKTLAACACSGIIGLS